MIFYDAEKAPLKAFYISPICKATRRLSLISSHYFLFAPFQYKVMPTNGDATLKQYRVPTCVFIAYKIVEHVPFT